MAFFCCLGLHRSRVGECLFAGVEGLPAALSVHSPVGEPLFVVLDDGHVSPFAADTGFRHRYLSEAVDGCFATFPSLHGKDAGRDEEQ